MNSELEKAKEFISPILLNGLNGRKLYYPSTKRPENNILLIYGHHAMLERWWGLVENLGDYGNVTMPDLPGFGGMDSLNKIGLYPNIDNIADYLVDFIEREYKAKKFSIYAISFGFAVVTRMLQRHPELVERVDILISCVGLMSQADFSWSRPMKIISRFTGRFFGTRPIALFIRYACLNRPIINTLTHLLPHSKHRFIEVTPEEFKATMDFEVKLWQANDVRTHWLTTNQFFTLDNTTKKIPLPAVHLVSEQDHYFNNEAVEKHMRQVFAGYQQFIIKSKAHTPSILAGKETMSIMVPSGLAALLSKTSGR